MKTITKKVRYAATVLAISTLTTSFSGVVIANEPAIRQEKTPSIKKIMDVDSIWDESNQELTSIRHGVPAYNEMNIVYRRDGSPLLDVELKAPIVLSVASKPEGWGYFQFPRIYRSATGQIVATWSYHDDDATSYGKEVRGFILSSDNGKTWHLSEQPAPWGDGLLLPASGDRISIHDPVPIPFSELQLPQPAHTFTERVKPISYYRLSEIPAALQGVYLNHWNRDGVWSKIHAGLEDPGACRHSVGDIFPLVWWGDMKLLPDNSIVAGIYPMFYERESGGFDPAGVSFYRTTDYGMNWKILGKIPYLPDLTVDPNGNRRYFCGFSEPAFEILSDGTFLCVMRTDDAFGFSPMYLSRSSDQGVTWSHPKAFTPHGVLPRLLQLENGVLVLASGRPGVQVRFSIDGKGEKWTDPFDMLPFIGLGEVSCGYTNILATGPDSFLIIYSDFKYLNQQNEVRKAIKIREIKVTKK